MPFWFLRRRINIAVKPLATIAAKPKKVIGIKCALQACVSGKAESGCIRKAQVRKIGVPAKVKASGIHQW